MFERLRNKISNYIFSNKIKELQDEIAVVRNASKGKIKVYCDNSNCFENDNGKECGMSTSIFLDKQGSCKEYLGDISIQNDFKEEVKASTPVQIIISED